MRRSALTTVLALGLFAAAVLTTAATVPVRADESPGTAFVNVTVIPMDREQAVPNQTVIVREGSIVAVGPTASTPVPDGVTRIDGKGRFLLPGLADMHVHLWSELELPLFLANGVTTIRNMWGSPLHQSLQTRVESGDLPGPTIYTTGPIVDGVPPIWPQSVSVKNAEEARAEVERQKAAGYEAVKVYSNLSQESYDAIVAAAKESGMRVDGHVPSAVGVEAALAAGHRIIEHLTEYVAAVKRDDFELKASDFRSRMKAAHGADPKKIDAIAKASKDAGAWNCVTLVVMQRFADTADGLAPSWLARPEMRYVSPQTKAFWDPKSDFRMQGMTEEAIRDIRKANEVNARITRALHDAGAGILLGTDTPNPLVVPGFAIHDELENLVRAGLSPYAALRTGTVNAAEALDREGEFGVIRTGSRADLLLLDANPLTGLATLRKPVGVMSRGRWLDAAALHERLEAVATSYGSTDER